MTDKRTDQLPAADPLDGSEEIAVVQAGNSRRVTAEEIANVQHDHAIDDIVGLQASIDGAGVATTEGIVGTTYTLVLADGATKYKRATNGAGCAITVPPDADVAFPADTVVTFRAATTGPVELIAGAGVTLHPPGGAGASLAFAEEGATVQIKKVAANEWDVIGGTAA